MKSLVLFLATAVLCLAQDARHLNRRWVSWSQPLQNGLVQFWSVPTGSWPNFQQMSFVMPLSSNNAWRPNQALDNSWTNPLFFGFPNFFFPWEFRPPYQPSVTPRPQNQNGVSIQPNTAPIPWVKQTKLGRPHRPRPTQQHYGPTVTPWPIEQNFDTTYRPWPVQEQFGTTFKPWPVQQQFGTTFRPWPTQQQFGTTFRPWSVQQQFGTTFRPWPTQQNFDTTFRPWSIQQNFKPTFRHWSMPPSIGPTPGQWPLQQQHGPTNRQWPIPTQGGPTTNGPWPAQQHLSSRMREWPDPSDLDLTLEPTYPNIGRSDILSYYLED